MPLPKRCLKVQARDVESEEETPKNGKSVTDSEVFTRFLLWNSSDGHGCRGFLAYAYRTVF